jgi:hypothetical protein
MGNNRKLSRRTWIGRASSPVLAASLGTGLLRPLSAEAASAGAPRADGDGGHDLGTRIYNVRAFGAKGDGQTLDTAALQASIDACTRDGGGTVLVPAGVFLTGTLELKSHVTLHLASSAKILGSADGKQYHAAEAIPLTGPHTIGDGNWALIFAAEARNVTVEGRGTIDGQGLQFHSLARGTPAPSGLSGSRRPHHLLFYKCENLTVRDVDLVDCAYHSTRIVQCRHVYIDGVRIHSRVNGNNDGFHFISAEHVQLSNCTVECQDDACALFGSCRWMTITNCYFSTRWSVFRFGTGVAENIAVSNCVLRQVYGCPFKLRADPGSRFENISFSNLLLEDVTGPIHIGSGPRAGRNPGTLAAAADRAPAVVRNISFSNIHGTVTTKASRLPDTPLDWSVDRLEELHSCIVLNAVGDNVIENISFDDVHLTFGGGGTAEDAARRDLPQHADEYFRLGPMPAYGLYARNARGITLHNVRLQVSEPDLRPALIFDHVQGASVRGLSVQGHRDAESVLRFIDSKDVLLSGTHLLTPSSPFLQLEGAANEAIVVEGGDVSKASSPVAYKNGAGEAAVKIRG